MQRTMKRKTVYLLLLLILLLEGCGTIVHGSKQDISVNATPPEATVKVDGKRIKTPATINLSRKNEHVVAIEMEGYENEQVKIERSLNVGATIFGNILWLIPGFVVDVITGGAWTLDPDIVNVALEKKSTKVEVGTVSAVPAGDVDSIVTTGSRQPGAYAVVIGIEEYRQRLPKADFAVQDAKTVGEYLTKAMGYEEENVVVLLNDRANKSDLEKYIESWLPNHVEKDNSVFVYFSGHGAPNTRTGEAYLVPYDGDPSFIDKTGYPLKRLYEQLTKLPAKEVVVVLDSCFSGAGGRSVIAKGMRPMVLSVENPLLAGGKAVVLSASSGDQVSSTYDAKGHGLLTYFFLKALQGEADQNKDRAIDLSEVFEYVKPQVERVARREFNNEQTPQLIGSPELLKRGVRLLDQGAPRTQPR